MSTQTGPIQILNKNGTSEWPSIYIAAHDAASFHHYLSRIPEILPHDIDQNVKHSLESLLHLLDQCNVGSAGYAPEKFTLVDLKTGEIYSSLK